MFFPDSPVWIVFSFVPFSSPVLVMLRLGITGVPAWQLAVSMAVLIASVIGGLWIAAKLLRIYLLMYGKRPRLREIVRALRAGENAARLKEWNSRAGSESQESGVRPPIPLGMPYNHLMTTWEWDAFVCHTSDDKESVARPLAQKLVEAGYRIWLDEAELRLGDSLRRKIDEGLARARFGVVILSPAFFSKEWPQKELDALSSLESTDRKVVLPIWHDLGREEIAEHSPLLAGRYAAKTSDGLDKIVTDVVRAIGPPSVSERGEPSKPEPRRANVSGDANLTAIDFSLEAVERAVDAQISDSAAASVLRTIRREMADLGDKLASWRQPVLTGKRIDTGLVEAARGRLRRLVPIWVAALSHGDTRLLSKLGSELQSFDAMSLYGHPIWLPLRLDAMAMAYVMGGIAVRERNPSAAREALPRTGWQNSTGARHNWFRDVSIEASRAGILAGSPISHILDLLSTDEYCLLWLGGKSQAAASLCGFDYLYCLDCFARGESEFSCFPSFKGFDRRNVEPFLADIAATCESGDWIPSMARGELARLVRKLDNHVRENHLTLHWLTDSWRSQPVLNLLSETVNRSPDEVG